jgi:gas vesicle protein
MATDNTQAYPGDATDESAQGAAPQVDQRPTNPEYRFDCPNPDCHFSHRVSPEKAETIRASGTRGVNANCLKCKTPLELRMRGGEVTATIPPEAFAQLGETADTKDRPRGGKRRAQADGDVFDAPAQRRVPEGNSGGLGRDLEELIRSELQPLEGSLHSGLQRLGALQEKVGAIPDGVSEQVRQHVRVLAKKIEDLQKSVGEITNNLSQFVHDFQGPIVEKLDAASEAVTAALQKVDAHTQQSAVQHSSLGKRLNAQGEKLDELSKITRKLYAAFDPVVELQKKRLEEMNEARDNELKTSNRERHDELMKMHDELFKTNEAIKATHEAGMQELRGKFAELGKSYDALRGALTGNTAKLDEFSKRHLSQEVLSQLLGIIASPDVLPALLNSYFAALSRQDGNQRRLYLIDQLPAMFDAVEGELNNWRQKCQSGQPDDTDRKILETLERVDRDIADWQTRQGIERFPDRGAKFDSHQHVKLRTEPVRDGADGAQSDYIAHVVRSGYRFKDTKQVLRKANVVVWCE